MKRKKKKEKKKEKHLKKSKDGRCHAIIFEKRSVIEKGKLFFFFNGSTTEI